MVLNMGDYLKYKEYRVAEDRRYAKTHEWIKMVEDDYALIGISDYAQKKLRDIVMIEEPEFRRYSKGERITVIESIKSVGDVYAPVDCIVVAWNENLLDNPALISEDPYGDGWIVRVKVEDKAQIEDLLTPKEYLELIKEEESGSRI